MGDLAHSSSDEDHDTTGIDLFTGIATIGEVAIGLAMSGNPVGRAYGHYKEIAAIGAAALGTAGKIGIEASDGVGVGKAVGGGVGSVIGGILGAAVVGAAAPVAAPAAVVAALAFAAGNLASKALEIVGEAIGNNIDTGSGNPTQNGFEPGSGQPTLGGIDEDRASPGNAGGYGSLVSNSEAAANNGHGPDGHASLGPSFEHSGRRGGLDRDGPTSGNSGGPGPSSREYANDPGGFGLGPGSQFGGNTPGLSGAGHHPDAGGLSTGPSRSPSGGSHYANNNRDRQDSGDHTATEGRRPILLDLDGNGIKLTKLSKSTTFTDTSGDGLKHGLGGRGGWGVVH